MTFEDFRETYQKVPVIEYPNEVVESPLVSVLVQTYQHVNFIKDCLEGILMQKTDFPFEILLGEDASTDGTREICLDYAKRNPTKIRLFLHDRANNISVMGRSTGKFNFLYNLFNSRTKYIAFCEGDDYWSDPYKLQKQVDFLENSSGFSMVCTDYAECDEVGNIIKEKVWGNRSSTINNETIIKQYKPKVLTSVILGEVITKNIHHEFVNVLNGDNFLFAMITREKPAYYLNEVTGCYRRTSGGVWSGASHRDQYEMQFQTYNTLLSVSTDVKARRAIYFRLAKISRVLVLLYLKAGNFSGVFKYGLFFIYSSIRKQTFFPM